MANLLAAPDDLPLGAKVRLTTNNQKIIESTVVPQSGGPGAGVDSFEGRTGAVVSASGDYTSSEIDNLSAVPGASVTNALNLLIAAIGSLVTGVSSFAGRGGAVVPAAADYSTNLVTNSSGVPGLTNSDALESLQQNGPPGGYTWAMNAAPAVVLDRFPFFFQSIAPQTNEDLCVLVVTRAFTARYFAFVASQSLLTDSLTCWLRRNKADTALTFVVPAGTAIGTIVADAAHTQAFAAGDKISVRVLQNGVAVRTAYDARFSVG